MIRTVVLVRKRGKVISITAVREIDNVDDDDDGDDLKRMIAHSMYRLYIVSSVVECL